MNGKAFRKVCMSYGSLVKDSDGNCVSSGVGISDSGLSGVGRCCGVGSAW